MRRRFALAQPPIPNVITMAPARRFAQLFAWLLLLAAVTLFPFQFRFGQVDLLAVDSVWPDRIPVVTDVILNVLLFVPFGTWLRGARGSRRGGRPIWQVAAAGLGIAAAVELLQGFLPRRDASVVDLLSNGTGALIGAWLHDALAATIGAQVARLRESCSTTVLTVAMGLLAIGAAALAGVLQTDSRLNAWSRDYPLLMGNERTGERPWNGRVTALDITDRHTPLDTMRRFAAGADTEIPGEAVATFRFGGRAPYHDAAGVVPALFWTRGEGSADNGVRFAPASAWLQSDGPAADLARRMEASNAFTLRVICASGDPAQAGPARIVSNSIDAGLRNFTLGQQGGDLVVRLRTAHTGLNGSRPEVRVPAVFTDANARDILVTYDGASLLVAVAGQGYVHRTDFTPGSSLAVAMTSLAVQADDLPLLSAVFTGAMFFTPGLAFGVLATGARRFAAATGWLLLLVALLESAQCLASGRAFSGSLALSTGGVGAVAFALGVVAGSPRVDADGVAANFS